MKIKFYRHIGLMCMAFVMISLSVSCSNDDEFNSDNNPDEYDPIAAAIKDSLAYEEMVHSLCSTDTLASGNIQHTITIAKAIYPEQPTSYYTIAESSEEAMETFYHTMVPISHTEKVEKLPNGDLRFTLLDATLLFHKDAGNEFIATVDVDIKKLPELKKVYFIRESEWPHNVSSPFTFGSVWRSPKGWLYICTADCRSQKGKLITFDGGWESDPFRAKTHWQGEFDVFCRCASKEAWEGMDRLHRYDPSKVNKILNQLSQHDYGNSKMYKYLKAIRDKKAGLDFNIGNHSWDKHLWWGYYCYDVTINYYSAYNRGFWSRYFTHKSTPVNGGADARYDDGTGPMWGTSSEIEFDFGYNMKDWKQVLQ